MSQLFVFATFFHAQRVQSHEKHKTRRRSANDSRWRHACSLESQQERKEGKLMFEKGTPTQRHDRISPDASHSLRHILLDPVVRTLRHCPRNFAEKIRCICSCVTNLPTSTVSSKGPWLHSFKRDHCDSLVFLFQNLRHCHVRRNSRSTNWSATCTLTVMGSSLASYACGDVCTTALPLKPSTSVPVCLRPDV